MTDDSLTDLESLWDRLLSREPGMIQSAFTALPAAEQAAVLQHLRRMAVEDGWHPEQRLSAEAALHSIQAGKPIEP